MQYTLFPSKAVVAEQQEAPGLSLGGFFYDYLRSVDGKMLGVRYWLIEDLNFEEHPVYSQFLEDTRLAFDPAGGYVDIVFDEHCAALLQGGRLDVDVVQAFGGESVVRQGNWFGIVFSISDEAW